MGLFGSNKRDKQEKVEKDDYYKYSSKNYPSGRSPFVPPQGPYGPPALPQTPPSPYLSGGGGYYGGNGYGYPSERDFQGYGQQKVSKYGKYKNLYTPAMGDMGMMLPPSAMAQAQQAAMMQMQPMLQQYMLQGANANGMPPVFGGVLPPITLPMQAAQQAGILNGAPQFAASPYGPAMQQPMMMSPYGATDPMQAAALAQAQGAFNAYQSYAPEYQFGGGYGSHIGYMPAF
ncbi:unnamed protein product [Didymodactylos carnosus]|uniref:Uncharacterized protein n=1 Tax=Didymodactylos carnosus TaxID=1234261 RepID=A0A813VLI1_9BILA|nr:unnamed protein product [Didymodactylos carnosus]CAF0903422.1 unnamed protein product [Didymodactylos carnosus]CAF3630823.1 unnamed protein product [Didymodactylos carnosus]CAF3683677.1 unnamed protein product [Didymodactylos carnosus]